ncbi:MAG TPA: hypothetical protein DDW36_03465 [Candidatus Magasanikbacteria bacterium]|nr:hypothetical protein [Candidatus Magasanikbacteria bacterium]
MNTSLPKLIIMSAALVVLGAACSKDTSAPLDDGGIFRTTDGGETWTRHNVYPTSQGVGTISRYDAIRIVIDPTDRKTIYAGTLQNGLVVSYDEGATWQHARQIKDNIVREIIIDPRDKCNVYVAWFKSVMRSTDCTRTFTEVYKDPQEGVQIRALAMHPDDAKTLYAGLSDGRVIKSIDSGATWRTMYHFKDRVIRFVINPENPAIMYAALLSKGLWRSIDGGESWESLKKKLAGAATAGVANFTSGYDVALDPSHNEVVYYATKVGIMRSPDDGESWEIVPILTSPGEARIYSVAVDPHDPKVIMYGATLGNRSVLYKTEDGGENWTIKKVPTTRISISLAFDKEKKGLIYLGTYFRPPAD